MSQGFSASVTFCWPPSGLIGSQFLDESQMLWSSAYADAKACHAQTPTNVSEVCPELWHLLQTPREHWVTPCQGSVVVPDTKAGVLSENVAVSESLEGGVGPLNRGG